jgi:retron-type reverse transcriptase
MPKTYNNLYADIVDFENLLRAYHCARKNKRYTFEVLEFNSNLEENLINIQNHLIWKSWQPGKYRCFIHHEPKKRFIQAPPFRDRVVHHALVQVIEPLFDKKFIHHSYACRGGKGTHAAVLYQQDCLRKANAKCDKAYVLKADISKYFQSINHRALYKILQRTIRDKDTLRLCATIIRHGGANGCGIPVGALTSQLFANVYLDQLDHYLKDRLGVEHYVRYMDDWVVMGPDKQYLHRVLAKAELFLGEGLKLTLNPKTQIFPASHGVDFCGYRIWPTHLLPRKKNVKRTKKRFKRLADQYSKGLISLQDIRPYVMSFLGYMRHCNSYKTRQSILGALVLQRKR